MYAGMSVRVCNLLRIHQPPPQTFSGVEQEHRKRLCWTAYCLDKMTSSELGMIPSFQPGQIKLEYPSSDQLRPEEACEFHEADFLRARIQLTFMKAEADVFIDMWQSIRDDVSDIQRRVRPILLKLEQWFQDDLPSYMSFDCESGLPEAMVQMPNMRSLCSFYLRCQQVMSRYFAKHVCNRRYSVLFCCFARCSSNISRTLYPTKWTARHRMTTSGISATSASAQRGLTSLS